MDLLADSVEVAAAVIRGVVPQAVIAKHLDPRCQEVDSPEPGRVLRMKLALEIRTHCLSAGGIPDPPPDVGGVWRPAETILRAQEPGADKHAQVAIRLQPGNRPPPGPPLARRIAVEIAPDPLFMGPRVDGDSAACLDGVAPLVVVEPDAARPRRIHESVVTRSADDTQRDARGGAAAHDHPVVSAPQH